MSDIDITRLSPRERIDLIGDLCESLGDEGFPVSVETRAELDRRNASFEDDKRNAVPWSEMRERLRPTRVA